MATLAVDRPLAPIGIGASLLYFGIPAAIFSASILGLLPWMIRHGSSQLLTFYVTFGGPLGLMLLAAFVFYRLEGRPWTWAAFRDRVRLRAMSPREFLYTVLLLVAIFGGQYLFGQFVAPMFESVHLYNSPKEFGEVMGGLQSGVFDNMPMHGRWDVFIGMSISLIVLNIFGEELWWRGIILPRQEVAMGNWAWVVNGFLWDGFHIFYHTTLASFVAYIPITVPLAFVAWKTRSTWPGIIAHLVTNGAVIVVLWQAVTR
ncbi:MAG: CPBP family intramembrane glutamic endopeptidase [Gemmatimonadaceae bacterium]